MSAAGWISSLCLFLGSACSAAVVELSADGTLDVGHDGGVAQTCGLEDNDTEVAIFGAVTYISSEQRTQEPMRRPDVFTYGNDGCWRSLEVDEVEPGSFKVLKPGLASSIYVRLSPARFVVSSESVLDLTQTVRGLPVEPTSNPRLYRLALANISPPRPGDVISVDIDGANATFAEHIDTLERSGSLEFTNARDRMSLSLEPILSGRGIDTEPGWATVAQLRESPTGYRLVRSAAVRTNSRLLRANETIAMDASTVAAGLELTVDVESLTRRLGEPPQNQLRRLQIFGAEGAAVSSFGRTGMLLATREPISERRLQTRLAYSKPEHPLEMSVCFSALNPLTLFLNGSPWVTPIFQGISSCDALANEHDPSFLAASMPKLITVAGQTADKNLSGFGVSPDVSWDIDPADVGSVYSVTLMTGADGGRLRMVARLFTRERSVRLPPGLMVVGQHYVASVSSHRAREQILMAKFPLVDTWAMTRVLSP